MANSNLSASSWFSFYGGKEKSKARVFVFPYSGAGSSIYYSWAKKFENTGIQLVGVQLPGRENRYNEPLIDSLPLLIKQLSTEIEDLTDQPYAFFGHSMGALIAYELSRKIHSRGFAVPKHLYVSGFRSPDLKNTNKPMAHLSDDDFIAEVINYGGMPGTMLENKELLELFLPILRADFLLTEYYSFKESSLLPIPISAFSGADDTIVYPEQMDSWALKTEREFIHHKYQGKHFFINDHADSIIEKLQHGF